ncbi:hypothetical protein [Rickettsia endosymbiont of Polydrusus tereticollis]|uniref:hypothetical protein n=1 Tax=Rickettsia endosymbiont of Polydrusus tereticollis TaxID=3066251 RepID=UPI003133228E
MIIFVCHSREGGNPEKYLSELYSEFLYNFAYFKYFLDSRLRGNDIRHFFRAIQQRLKECGMKIARNSMKDQFLKDERIFNN